MLLKKKKKNPWKKEKKRFVITKRKDILVGSWPFLLHMYFVCWRIWCSSLEWVVQTLRRVFLVLILLHASTNSLFLYLSEMFCHFIFHILSVCSPKMFYQTSKGFSELLLSPLRSTYSFNLNFYCSILDDSQYRINIDD